MRTIAALITLGLASVFIANPSNASRQEDISLKHSGFDYYSAQNELSQIANDYENLREKISQGFFIGRCVSSQHPTMRLAGVLAIEFPDDEFINLATAHGYTTEDMFDYKTNKEIKKTVRMIHGWHLPRAKYDNRLKLWFVPERLTNNNPQEQTILWSTADTFWTETKFTSGHDTTICKFYKSDNPIED